MSLLTQLFQFAKLQNCCDICTIGHKKKYELAVKGVTFSIYSNDFFLS